MTDSNNPSLSRIEPILADCGDLITGLRTAVEVLAAWRQAGPAGSLTRWIRRWRLKRHTERL